MKKIDRYLEEVKQGILEQYEKELKVEMTRTLASLHKERDELAHLVDRKQKAMTHQKEVMKIALALSSKRQQDEKVQKALVDHVWKKTIDAYFSAHSEEWYLSVVSHLPTDKGVVTYNPTSLSQRVIREMRSEGRTVELVEDPKMSEGFIFESETAMIDGTKQAFSQEQYERLKHVVREQLQKEKLV